MARKIRLEYVGAVLHVSHGETRGAGFRRTTGTAKGGWNRWREDARKRVGGSTPSGGAKMEHGQAEARRLLGAGLAALGMEGLDLRQQSKGMAEKQVLAWWLSRRTTVRRRWVSEQMGMGDESRVTQAIRRVIQGAEPNLARIERQIEERAGIAAPS